ncbi:MAG: transglutaminase domain-containing protein [Myxococcota bacterium]
MRRSPALVLALFLALLAGCASVPRPTLSKAEAVDDAALAAAVEAFYRAETPEQLRAAVAAAEKAGPATARFHEIAAGLALLEGREEDLMSHLLAALTDTGDDAALLHLHQLDAMSPSFAQRPVYEAHLRALADTHPDPSVRAVAVAALAPLLTSEGAFEERDARVAAVPGRVKLAWVGTWDNDQGKGFDLKLGPEDRPGLDETYEGRVGPLAWRRDVPLDPRGRYDLLQLMTPTRWAAAFAQGELRADADGDYALVLTSTDPLKVWVDGREVFSDALLKRSVEGHLVVPLSLKKGVHSLLIKSAHREGAWSLNARFVPLTGEGPATSVEGILAWRVRHLPAGSARQHAHTTLWAHLGAGGDFAVKHADAFAQAFPKSILARLWVVDALWFNQERGRTADLLSALDAEVGEALPFVRLRQTRFHFQQGLKQRVREKLVPLAKEKPYLRDVWDQLADLWRSEGWTEDELAALEKRASLFSETPDEVLSRARAQQRLGRREQALAIAQSVLDRLPAFAEALRYLSEQRQAEGRLEDAARLMQRRLDAWPVDFSTWMALAEVRRRQGERPAAEAALERASALSPEAALPWSRRGDLAYQAGETEAAVKAWRRAVELHPEDESLANRIDFLSPEARGPWMADIPSEEQLAELVRSRAQLRQEKGADYAYLLDHEVTLLNTDGSTSNVITLVIHAFNAQGRDRIIRQSVGQGRLRVLHAYAVDEKGQRLEASGERGRSIFFRGMQPGSTLVLQYRLDVPPKGYLARYFTEAWSFQGIGNQRKQSTYVLWVPLTTKLHEHRVGEGLTRTEERRGEQLRIVWQAVDTPPLVAEPAMPTVGELSINIRLSTVPDWTTWLSWEQALLEGAFRDSPELDALAKKLGEGAPDTEEKLKRVHAFVMEEIRYQQDYESFIAGVKPHPAPMVLERRYGDCKDKAVLFIELAKKLGVDAHFALVRTRDAGPVDKDVPMQQFNHAIVYVPEQAGLAAGRFFDPTAELLDLDAVRTDDVGTWSLVFDPKTNQHTWRDIPYQAPEANRETTRLSLTLDEKGGATGLLTLESVGRAGSGLRRTSKNAEVFSQVLQRVAAHLLPNGSSQNPKAVEVEDLRKPAVVTAEVSTTSLARPEGDTLRLKLPTEANPRSTFSLAQRRHPLVLGTPQQSTVQLELTLPAGLAVKKLPASGTVSLPCLSLARTVSQAGAVVKSTETYRTTCERISPTEYLAYRAKLDEMVRLLDDELVLGAAKGAKKPAAAEAKR